MNPGGMQKVMRDTVWEGVVYKRYASFVYLMCKISIVGSSCIGALIKQTANQTMDDNCETVKLVSTLSSARYKPLLADHCVQNTVSSYVRFGRYGGKGVTQMEAELCGLQIHSSMLSFSHNQLAS